MGMIDATNMNSSILKKIAYPGSPEKNTILFLRNIALLWTLDIYSN